MTKITKITLTIGKQEIELTPKEVKELKEALDEVYAEPITVERPYPIYRDRWWDYPLQPRWTTTASGDSNIHLCVGGQQAGGSMVVDDTEGCDSCQ